MLQSGRIPHFRGGEPILTTLVESGSAPILTKVGLPVAGRSARHIPTAGSNPFLALRDLLSHSRTNPCGLIVDPSLARLIVRLERALAPP